jgi:hypothetical protein
MALVAEKMRELVVNAAYRCLGHGRRRGEPWRRGGAAVRDAEPLG